MPDHIKWPKYCGEYIPFLCQIQLKEIAPWDFEGKLPNQGWLYVFDSQELDEGYQLIYYDGDLKSLEPCYVEEDKIFEEGEYYQECEVSISPVWMLATYPSSEFEHALRSHGEDPLDVYWEVKGELEKLAPSLDHQIFGYPFMGDSGDDDTEALFLEVSSDDEMDLLIWDAGFTQYFTPITNEKPFLSFEKIERSIYSS